MKALDRVPQNACGLVRSDRSFAAMLGVVAFACTHGDVLAQIPPLNVHLVANWDDHPTDYTAAEVWADDQGYAYVCNRFGATVDIMDISDPAVPFLETTYVVGPPNNFANAKEVKVANGLMFVGLDDDGNDGVEVVDVRDPAQPQFLTNIKITGFFDVHNVFYDRGFLYMANSQNTQIVVVDLRDIDPDIRPMQNITQEYWRVIGVGSSRVHDITVSDGRLYAAAWDSGLWVYDVRDIANQPPIFLASAPGDNTHSAWPTRDQRWIVTNEERTNGGPVNLYEMMPDTGNGYTLELRHTFSIPQADARSSHNVYVVGYRAYCAWYNRGLMAFDIDPIAKELRLVAHYDTSVNTTVFHGAWGVYPFLGRDKVLVSDKETQFWIFDVRIPASGDFDGDSDVDLRDWVGLQQCFSGESKAYPRDECEIFDFDADNDVDLTDVAAHTAAFTGPR